MEGHSVSLHAWQSILTVTISSALVGFLHSGKEAPLSRGTDLRHGK